MITRAPGARLDLDGWIGRYAEAVSENWLKVAPFSNPAILEMFRDRDRQPLRELLPWSGEFAGKYLTSAVQVYRLTGDASLRSVIVTFVEDLIALQADDGYLGPWPVENRLTGTAPNVRLHFPPPFDKDDRFRKTWDVQGHYHTMLGLIFWFEESGDAAALNCAKRIGDLLCVTFEEGSFVDFDDEPLDENQTEINHAAIHSLCLLYRHTRDERYLRLAEKIRSEFTAVGNTGHPVGGDYVDGPLAGKEFWELPQPRWESLFPVIGLVELYAITGEDDLRRAFESIWWSIVKGDRHNNGGFSSHEQATGNPYNQGPIETCCTVAWIAMSVEMLRLTGNSVVADELELSTLNSVMGYHSPDGSWVTYNTPMDGVRQSSSTSIPWQSREGSPGLNCCSPHGARGIGMISDWALMASDDGVIVNWYGPGSMTTTVADGHLTIRQETEYPRDGRVRLTFESTSTQPFTVRLRIPYWSTTTHVEVNDEAVPHVEPGRYLELNREWTTGDQVDIDFDLGLQYWVGEREGEGRSSIYRGPLLLTYDRRFNSVDPDDLPALDARDLAGELVSFDGVFPPVLLMEFRAEDGRRVRLCDFGSAGVGGSPYRSWLEVDSCPKVDFSTLNPRRSAAVVPERDDVSSSGR